MTQLRAKQRNGSDKATLLRGGGLEEHSPVSSRISIVLVELKYLRVSLYLVHMQWGGGRGAG